MENEKPDFLEKFKSRVLNLHTPIIDLIPNSEILKERIQFSLEQLNFGEYLDVHPIEPNYNFILCNANWDNFSTPILFAFNRYFYKSIEESERIIKHVSECWNKEYKIDISIQKNEVPIQEMKIAPDSMLFTIHYLYPEQELKEAGIDFQLFKICYFYDLINGLFDERNKKGDRHITIIST